ncbi:MAG: hypothetical protein ACMXYD_04915 [Candidatus Woesearchaeota archaeon]
MDESFIDFLEVLDECKDISTIVEGPNDKVALTQLGFSAVYVLDEPLFVVAERFCKGDVVQILTDFDREGKQLFASLRHQLSQRGVRIDRRLRLAVKETGVSKIEELATFVSRRV